MPLNFYLYLAQVVLGVGYVLWVRLSRRSDERWIAAKKFNLFIGIFFIVLGSIGVARNVFWPV